LKPHLAPDGIADSALMARLLYERVEHQLLEAMENSRNGRRLLAVPELREDVPFCAQRDTLSWVAGRQDDGSIRLWRE